MGTFLEEPALVRGVVPLELVMARSARAAVILEHIAVGQVGFEFDITVQLRGSLRFGNGWYLQLLVDPDRVSAREDPIPDELLRFGIEFPDGTHRTSLVPRRRGGWSPWWVNSATSGDLVELRWHWEASPTPLTGMLILTCEWPAVDIPETRVELDASLFAAAASRCQLIWPELSDSGDD